MAKDDDTSMTTSEAGSMSSGKFEKGSERARAAGRKGAENQSIADKAKGGARSHGGGRRSSE